MRKNKPAKGDAGTATTSLRAQLQAKANEQAKPPKTRAKKR